MTAFKKPLHILLLIRKNHTTLNLLIYTFPQKRTNCPRKYEIEERVPCTQIISFNSLRPFLLSKIEQQLRVLDNVRSAFDPATAGPTSGSIAGGQEPDAGTDDDSMLNFGAVDMLSPSGHTDAQTLALMLQEQLDAINNEIR